MSQRKMRTLRLNLLVMQSSVCSALLPAPAMRVSSIVIPSDRMIQTAPALEFVKRHRRNVRLRQFSSTRALCCPSMTSPV